MTHRSADTAPDPLVTVPEGVILQHVADETVLLHLESGVYYGLNPSGTRMLDLARGLPDVASVVEAMAAEFDDTPGRDALRADLVGLLGELNGKGLVVVEGDEVPPIATPARDEQAGPD